ncbi:MAG: peptidoglycan-binding protein LysM [Hyphomicrobiales bacterium]
MGLFDFIKEAGKALGIGGDEEPPSAEDLKKELDSHNLGTDNVTVEVQGDKAIIKGQVDDQSVFEKAVIAVGNTLGISQVETEVDVPDAKDPVFHTVEKGDTLWAVAKAQYGNGSKYNAIFEANKPMLTHPDKIYPGQVLRIPELD